MANEWAPSPRSWRGWTRGEGIIAVAGVLLVGDLVVLPWHHYALDVNVANLGIDLPKFAYDRSALQAPNGFFGVLALILSALMVIQVFAAKLNPSLPRRSSAQMIAGATVFGLIMAKVLANHEFLGDGAWLALIGGGFMALGGYMLSRDFPVADVPAARRHE